MLIKLLKIRKKINTVILNSFQVKAILFHLTTAAWKNFASSGKEIVSRFTDSRVLYCVASGAVVDFEQLMTSQRWNDNC